LISWLPQKKLNKMLDEVKLAWAKHNFLDAIAEAGYGRFRKPNAQGRAIRILAGLMVNAQVGN
jgi:hypothetical protein